MNSHFSSLTRTREGCAQWSTHVHSLVLCTVAAALTCTAVMQVKGLNIRSMRGAARWLLQQVWLSL